MEKIKKSKTLSKKEKEALKEKSKDSEPETTPKEVIEETVANFQLFQKSDPDVWNFNKSTKWENIRKEKEFVMKVNIYPIFESFSLIIPFVIRDYPQFIKDETFLAATMNIYYNVLDQKESFRQYVIGYNSAGAFSTINHLHF